MPRTVKRATRVSLVFPRPDTDKIAVKVINDDDDEVMQVFDV